MPDAKMGLSAVGVVPRFSPDFTGGRALLHSVFSCRFWAAAQTAKAADVKPKRAGSVVGYSQSGSLSRLKTIVSLKTIWISMFSFDNSSHR